MILVCFSSTDGPSLEATWGIGNYDQTNKWYRFGAGQGLELNMFNCISKGSVYTIYIKVSLDSVSGWRRLLGSQDWNENGVRKLSVARTIVSNFVYKNALGVINANLK